MVFNNLYERRIKQHCSTETKTSEPQNTLLTGKHTNKVATSGTTLKYGDRKKENTHVKLPHD